MRERKYRAPVRLAPGMSVSAHILRLGLRYFVKRRLSPEPRIDALRASMDTVLSFVPSPPRGTQTVNVDADGVKALSVSTPHSREGRRVLYLHGGGYVMGS